MSKPKEVPSMPETGEEDFSDSEDNKDSEAQAQYDANVEKQ
jgi:hypothetical protein